MSVTGKVGWECVYLYSLITVSQNILQHQATYDHEFPEQEVIFFT